MNIQTQFNQRMAELPLVAILRGITPEEVEAVGEALVEEGFGLIEVPLNSPDALTSIERLAKKLGSSALVGAGTVLTEAAVRAVQAAGGVLIVSPNINPAVIRATVAADMISLPGCFTPTEAFAALEAGAHVLKYFPAEAMSPQVLRAQGAVIPADVPKLVVGGITPDNMVPWRAAGAAGFGLGSALYRVGASPADVGESAAAFVAGWRTSSQR